MVSVFGRVLLEGAGRAKSCAGRCKDWDSERSKVGFLRVSSFLFKSICLGISKTWVCHKGGFLMLNIPPRPFEGVWSYISSKEKYVMLQSLPKTQGLLKMVPIFQNFKKDGSFSKDRHSHSSLLPGSSQYAGKRRRARAKLNGVWKKRRQKLSDLVLEVRRFGFSKVL